MATLGEMGGGRLIGVYLQYLLTLRDFDNSPLLLIRGGRLIGAA